MRKTVRFVVGCLMPVLLAALPGPRAAQAQDAAAIEQRLDELALGTRVRLALLNDETLEPFTFEVEVRGADVTVSGLVQTGAQRDRVEAIASRLRGVGKVVNAVALSDGALPDEDAAFKAGAGDPEGGDFDDIDIDALDPLQPPDPEVDPDAAAADGSEVWETEGSGAEGGAAGEAGAVVPDGFHRVEEGDTLLRISERYQFPIREIRRLNNLSRTDTLETGRLLRIQP